MTQINLFRHATDIIDYQPGQIIFNTGDAGDVMYAVVEGTVDILVGENVIDSAEPGGIFGEMALVDGSPRSATARARTAVKLTPLGEKQFLRMVEQTPLFALQVMRIMSERLRRLIQASQR